MTGELMVHCAQVNLQYMDLEAGQLQGYEAMVGLYRRIADQSFVCAQSMYEHRSCPRHSPAVDAFWWANVSWALTIGKGIGADKGEWYEVFVSPHIAFASYLKPVSWDLRILANPVAAEDIIIFNDILWAKLVIKLTARWGMLQHLRDIRALLQTRKLLKKLSRRHSREWNAYLDSDIIFLRRLFEPFAFTTETRHIINSWLYKANLERS